MPTRICFVCLGNICRSPTAQGVFEHLVQDAGRDAEFEIDSAGTAAYHVGERADRRSAATAAGRGIELRSRARQFVAADFARFDMVVAMDHQNAADLRELAPDDQARAKVILLRSFDPQCDPDAPEAVPDPYYGGASGFDEVLDICMRSCRALLTSVTA